MAEIRNVTAKEFLGRQLRESREQVERAQAALSGFAAEHPNVADYVPNKEPRPSLSQAKPYLQSGRRSGLLDFMQLTT